MRVLDGLASVDWGDVVRGYGVAVKALRLFEDSSTTSIVDCIK